MSQQTGHPRQHVGVLSNALDFRANTLDFSGNTLNFWGNTLGFQGNELDFPGNTLDFQGNTLDFWGNMLDLRANTLDFHGNTFDFRGNTLDSKFDNTLKCVYTYLISFTVYVTFTREVQIVLFSNDSFMTLPIWSMQRPCHAGLHYKKIIPT